jgi:hypothetical protein
MKTSTIFHHDGSYNDALRLTYWLGANLYNLLGLQDADELGNFCRTTFAPSKSMNGAVEHLDWDLGYLESFRGHPHRRHHSSAQRCDASVRKFRIL